MIFLASQLPDNVKQIIYKVFSNNAYFVHPEHLLLTMLHDSRKHIRELVVRCILGARDKKTKNSGGLRFFKLPKLNFEVADYIDLIDWSNCVVTEPPLKMHIKDKDLKEMCKEEQFPALNFEEFPCHTQSVERCVKLISEAEMKVCGETARDGYICAKFQARKELPTFNNKGQCYSNT
ncbi:hypothetical protein AVEN_202100-1 [Araneus ventricosus]|uniref:Uncharacterized protein n=1 Tax=Araneus ventricosus TaxID=182803 RepID=A0A4Y2EDT1_ARAVE|nr:hypothetical protein AVEN_176932-1 [Araneus ventricosus]GBM27282.1 hypothetical protein AVEN_202100-1 [Araneus ventricosus]